VLATLAASLRAVLVAMRRDGPDLDAADRTPRPDAPFPHHPDFH
jgi:hypothetical protein